MSDDSAIITSDIMDVYLECMDTFNDYDFSEQGE